MVERILGKAEVVSSILTGSTIFRLELKELDTPHGDTDPWFVVAEARKQKDPVTLRLP